MFEESDFDELDAVMDEVIKHVEGEAEQVVSAAAKNVSTASAPVTTAGVSMRSEKAKAKAVIFRDVEESDRPTRPHLPKIDPKDKGKGIMIEEEPVKVKRRDHGPDQIQADKELAKNKADEQLAIRLQSQEQEQFTIDQKARMLAEMIAERKKFFATQRAAEIRNKPPTKAQVRNRMCTYLKNQPGYRYNQLNGRSYEEIQKLFDKAYKQVNDFVPMNFEMEENRIKKAGSRLNMVVGSTLKQKSPKKLKDEDRAVDYETLDVKLPIVDWESQILGNLEGKDIHCYKITRADGSSRYYKTFSRMLEGFDNLHTLIKPNEEDEVWKNQQDWKLISWKLYETCGVHTLWMDGTSVTINMLIEKKYHLTHDMLTRMLTWRLEAYSESIMAYELIKFIKSQLEE
ncbi:hypothetical protein Tco_1415638 [Tanacetum coccineum]